MSARVTTMLFICVLPAMASTTSLQLPVHSPVVAVSPLKVLPEFHLPLFTTTFVMVLLGATSVKVPLYMRTCRPLFESHQRLGVLTPSSLGEMVMVTPSTVITSATVMSPALLSLETAWLMPLKLNVTSSAHALTLPINRKTAASIVLNRCFFMLLIIRLAKLNR